LFLGKLKLKISGPNNHNPNSASTIQIKLMDTTWRKWGWWVCILYAGIFYLAYYLVKRFLF